MNNDIKELQDSIVKASSSEEIGELKEKIHSLKEVKSSNQKTNYSKQKVLEAIDSLIKMADAKKNSLETSVFKFEGDPIKTDRDDVAAIIPTFDVVPFKEGISQQRVDVNHVGHLLLRSFDHCVVIDNTSSSVNIQDGKSSILNIDINGTVSITGLDNCVVWVNCHQLRLHDVRNSLIITDISSTIIIENCENLKFTEGVKVDDFNFEFEKSVNFQYVQNVNTSGLDWIHQDFDQLKLMHALNDLI